MKKFSLFLSICISYLSYSQDLNTVYYNTNWQITSSNYGKYYRNSGFNPLSLTFDSTVVDHYMDGTVEMTGKYLKGLKEGEFIYYYPNHSVRLISNYHDNKKSGQWTSYFENGQINKIVEFNNNKERLIKYCDYDGKDNMANMSGKYLLDFYYDYNYFAFSQIKLSDQSQKYIVKGKLKNGYKDGYWTISRFQEVLTRTGDGQWNSNNEKNVSFKLKFENGNFVSGWQLSTDNEKLKLHSDTLSFLILEPEKINITESLICEPGQMIRQNYVMKALLNSKNQPVEKIELNNESDLYEYFKSQYSIYVKNCSDTFRIKINLDVNNIGKLTVDSISKNISTSMSKEVFRVINSISNLKFIRNKKLELDYRILCVNELDYKK